MKKRDSMLKKMKLVMLLLLLLVWTTLTGKPMVFSFQDTRTTLFKEVEQLMEQAREVQAGIYSPTQFNAALKSYNQADEDYKKAKNLEAIRRKISEATALFQKAMETTKIANLHFKDCINARNDALAAEAPAFRNEQWEKAEELLKEAAETLEKGRLNPATSKAKEAELVYRQVELESIKANYLDETKTFLEENEKELTKSTPETFEKAQNAILMAEKLLMENRYDTDEARQHAQQAKYEAQHAQYLAQIIETMRAEDKTIESLILDSEKPLQKIADSFDINAKFHQGFDPPVQNIVQDIQELKRHTASLQRDLIDKEEQISTLSTQISQMESQMGEMKSQLGDLKTKEEDLTQLMEQQRLRREKFTRVEKTFTSEEAQILREGDRVIIRLYALTFPVGRATIEPQYFGLLSKVIKAIREYPEYHIMVEGHTDSRGSDEVNMKLSTERADAVREYLVASGNIEPVRIQAMAFGESNPIASNDTEVGRRKNRRITFVIHPEE